MGYKVTIFTGDYPVENQPSWYTLYETLEEAVTMAKMDMKHLLLGSDHYAIVTDQDDELKYAYHDGQEFYNPTDEFVDSLMEKTNVVD